jgi:hypothetical protein
MILHERGVWYLWGHSWEPLLFAYEDLEAKKSRDPVTVAQRSKASLEKVRRKTLENDSPVHSFRSLIKNMATIVRNTCSRKDDQEGNGMFSIDTQPSELQIKAFELVKAIRM